MLPRAQGDDAAAAAGLLLPPLAMLAGAAHFDCAAPQPCAARCCGRAAGQAEAAWAAAAEHAEAKTAASLSKAEEMLAQTQAWCMR